MIVPLFPLPNVVLFPKTPVPLYIFEERYRVMIREAIAGNREIVIALLRPGGETGPGGMPEVHDIACLGRIESYEELEDGKYNIVVVGVDRVRILREVRHSPYQQVEVERIEPALPGWTAEEIAGRQSRIGELFARFTELATGTPQQVNELMPQLDFDALVNMVAMTLNLAIDQKQALLELDDASERCDALIPVLEQQLETLVLVRRFEHIKPENPHFN
ncbi:MAG: LON peptidase substrate-binding domain-containing protein [Acidobacteriota bacterium]|jgi:Lon protease-like protein|nr:LON peptidase substrate-binding domain-containing protein [Acidobacteriota bacterium]NLT33121.1 ATP-dependent protease [Acidobacteriota bacterium]